MRAILLQQKLKKLAHPGKAKILRGFFKTGPGDYSEGDIFIGVTMPQLRSLAKEYFELSYTELTVLLKSEIHEARMLALVVITTRVAKNLKSGLKSGQRLIKSDYHFYIKNKGRINNWDLIDISAPTVLGGFLFSKERSVLFRLANSKKLWERRMAIISTLYFIRKNDFLDTVSIAEILLEDKEDLIQKAVGWMLREVGKRNIDLLITFLNKNSAKMPRVMLRYAIEKLPQKQRQYFLKRR
jgi:3-methyladenine DNA glycosylase AlkD